MNDRLSRIGGAALLAGSAASIVLAVTLRLGDAEVDWTNPMNIAARWASLPATLLLVFGLPALVLRLSSGAAVLALLGSAGVAVSFLVYNFAVALIDAVVLPYLVAKHVDVSQPPAPMFIAIVAGGVGEIIGGILLGVAALRSHAVSRAAAVLMLTSGLLTAITLAPVPEWIDTIAAVLLLTGLAILGTQLLGFGGRGIDRAGRELTGLA